MQNYNLDGTFEGEERAGLGGKGEEDERGKECGILA